MGLSAHPCCGCGIWGRLPEPIADRICTLAYSGRNVTDRIDWNREQLLLELPLSTEQALILLPPGPAPTGTRQTDDEDEDEDESPPEHDGVLLQARCPWCEKDFAAGSAPDAWAINLLRLHMNRRDCR
jgi:hypothetical protein